MELDGCQLILIGFLWQIKQSTMRSDQFRDLREHFPQGIDLVPFQKFRGSVLIIVKYKTTYFCFYRSREEIYNHQMPILQPQPPLTVMMRPKVVSKSGVTCSRNSLPPIFPTRRPSTAIQQMSPTSPQSRFVFQTLPLNQSVSQFPRQSSFVWTQRIGGVRYYVYSLFVSSRFYSAKSLCHLNGRCYSC